MPIEIRDADGGLGNIIRGWGVVTEEEFVVTYKQHLTQFNDRFRKYRYSLTDWTAVTEVKVSIKVVELISELCKDAWEFHPDAVDAIAADADITFGLSRMWEMLTDVISWETMVFRSRVDAEAWIKERVKEKYGIDDLTFSRFRLQFCYAPLQPEPAK